MDVKWTLDAWSAEVSAQLPLRWTACAKSEVGLLGLLTTCFSSVDNRSCVRVTLQVTVRVEVGVGVEV